MRPGRFSPTEIRLIRYLAAWGIEMTVIAKATGIPIGTVQAIVYRTAYRGVA